jgi:hypothetical protein
MKCMATKQRQVSIKDPRNPTKPVTKIPAEKYTRTAPPFGTGNGTPLPFGKDNCIIANKSPNCTIYTGGAPFDDVVDSTFDTIISLPIRTYIEDENGSEQVDVIPDPTKLNFWKLNANGDPTSVLTSFPATKQAARVLKIQGNLCLLPTFDEQCRRLGFGELRAKQDETLYKLRRGESEYGDIIRLEDRDGRPRGAVELA